MKRYNNASNRPLTGLIVIFLAITIGTIQGTFAQDKQSVTGKLIDEKSRQAIQYAYVTLTGIPDSTILRGTIADDNGVFKISPVPKGNYRLLVSYIGYKPVIKNINVGNSSDTNAGMISLQETAIFLNETVVLGEHLKAKSEQGKTTYFITKKIVDVTNTGSDVLKMIPGIQIDLMQNISLEGSQMIRIYVDGKERDKSFISQLNPKQIEKVEIITAPPSNYDSNLTGAINVILKKEHDSGFSGQICSEIPTTGSEIFMFPTCSLNFGFKKWNLFTSYSGELTYLDLHEQTDRKAINNWGNTALNSSQDLRQKDWSHKFNYGFDYFLTPCDQFNFYAFYNPYSRELDGIAYSQTVGSFNRRWQAKKEDQDINVCTSYSVYYKHKLKKKGDEISLEISNYNLNAENSTVYTTMATENNNVMMANSINPKQQVTSLKLDFMTQLTNNLNFSIGLKERLLALQDRSLPDFSYHEKIFALYGTAGLKHQSYDLSLGLRTEKSLSDLKDRFSNSNLSILPYAIYRYKITSGQNIQFTYNRTLGRPNLYQLIPSIIIDDPNTITKGNSGLQPELRSNLFLEHSVQFKSNYFASRLFYSSINNVINNLTVVNDTGAFETRIQNLGTIHKFGIQFSGSFKVGRATLNPYLQFYEQNISGNTLAKQYGIQDRKGIGFDSSLSAILSFKHDFAFSLIFQYATPRNNIQDNSFCDPLYFLSLEKSLKNRIKIGLVSAIPFTKSFVFKGSDIQGSNFSSHYQGNVKATAIPVWFKVSYQINTGKKRDKVNSSREEINNLPKKGF